MTTLADLAVGNVIVVMGQITAQDQVVGDTMAMLGPDGSVNGTIIISPAGVFSGQLAAAANLVPVQLVPGLNAVTIGDVLVNNRTGETMVARRVVLENDGSYRWAASLSGGVLYTMAEWNVVGTAAIA